MKVFVDKMGEKFEVELPENSTVKDLLEKLDLEDYLVVKGGEILSEHEKISDSDKLRLVPVVSGG
ncbi:MAG: sulfur carrier protein [Methanothermococcus sp.]|uniref:MoaD/ThiS family protein n=1 Tax=Methanothermococcus TaxID=155862 RepID=UPI0003738EEC|nr:MULTISPECIES: MoaD/ThiS family protein [Methanothermococcus]MDK2790165.1 sulfur carrier protein [Methanothermococcus sp.]MDK2987031.1 sulfur carrier protein [Methanothermococcus sp.]